MHREKNPRRRLTSNSIESPEHERKNCYHDVRQSGQVASPPLDKKSHPTACQVCSKFGSAPAACARSASLCRSRGFFVSSSQYSMIPSPGVLREAISALLPSTGSSRSVRPTHSPSPDSHALHNYPSTARCSAPDEPTPQPTRGRDQKPRSPSRPRTKASAPHHPNTRSPPAWPAQPTRDVISRFRILRPHPRTAPSPAEASPSPPHPSHATRGPRRPQNTASGPPPPQQARLRLRLRHRLATGIAHRPLHRRRDRNLPMVHPYAEMRHQRALDVPDHLLRCARPHHEEMNRVNRARRVCHYSRRNDILQGRQQLLRFLQRKHRPRNLQRLLWLCVHKFHV